MFRPNLSQMEIINIQDLLKKEDLDLTKKHIKDSLKDLSDKINKLNENYEKIKESANQIELEALKHCAQYESMVGFYMKVLMDEGGEEEE